jgi:excisionase family DNA binding protein
VIGRRCAVKNKPSLVPLTAPSAPARPIDLAPLAEWQPIPDALGEITFEEAARYLRITTRTLYQRIKDGRPHPKFKTRFGRKYFKIDDLATWHDDDDMAA